MKFMLACDANLEKLKFPLIVQPKIDGVRAGHLTGGLTGRSLKKHKNTFTTSYFSRPEFAGFDGELAAQHATHPDLCRLTTSAVGTIAGEPYTLWWLFDYVTEETKQLSYSDRLTKLSERVNYLRENNPEIADRLRVVPWRTVRYIEELTRYEDDCLSEGYEGVILRDPDGKYKEGRSTVKEGGLLRIKRFMDVEAVVEGITEGQANGNEAQIDERGLQFRSSHQANLSPNGMIGTLQCRLVSAIVVDNEEFLSIGDAVTVSPGNMTHQERVYFFQNKREIFGKTIKCKFFPKGLKEKPRFMTFVSFRDEEDM